MNVITVIKTNPLGVTKALAALASAGVILYFTLAGKPDSSNSIVNEISGLIVPVATAFGIFSALVSTLHFSRGPVPSNPPAAPVAVTSSAVLPKQ